MDVRGHQRKIETMGVDDFLVTGRSKSNPAAGTWTEYINLQSVFKIIYYNETQDTLDKYFTVPGNEGPFGPALSAGVRGGVSLSKGSGIPRDFTSS